MVRIHPPLYVWSKVQALSTTSVGRALRLTSEPQCAEPGKPGSAAMAGPPLGSPRRRALLAFAFTARRSTGRMGLHPGRKCLHFGSARIVKQCGGRNLPRCLFTPYETERWRRPESELQSRSPAPSASGVTTRARSRSGTRLTASSSASTAGGAGVTPCTGRRGSGPPDEVAATRAPPPAG